MLLILFSATCIHLFIKARLSLVILLVVLFMVSCLTWIIENKLKLIYFRQTGDDVSCILQEDSQAHTTCVWFSIMVSINCTSFNVACWLFAMRYWTLSNILYMVNQGKQLERGRINIYNFVMWFGLAINFSVSMLYGFLLYRNTSTYKIYLILPLLWISSFSFLADGLRRIHKVMKTLSDHVVIFSAFLMQSATCALFILGQAPNVTFAILNAKGDYLSTKAYTIISIFNNATCFICEICLIIIFN